MGTSAAELCTWASLAGGFHRPDEFGMLRFSDTPAAWLTAQLPGEFQPGDVSVQGNVPGAARHCVALQVLPAEGNPTCADTSVQDGAFKVTAPICNYGGGRLALSLMDESGATVYRIAAPYDAPEPQSHCVAARTSSARRLTALAAAL